MDLKEFVKNALLDITLGIEEADSISKREMHLAQPHDNKCVMFDIAVTVEASATEKSEGAIKILVADISGEINGTFKKENGGYN